jgi:malate/lactate dehydrogenase
MASGQQLRALLRMTGPDDVTVCEAADVLVLTVGGVPQPGQNRLDLAEDSVTIRRDLLPPLLEVAAGAVRSVVDRTGVPWVRPIPVCGDEREGLHRSAHAIRAVIDKLAF